MDENGAWRHGWLVHAVHRDGLHFQQPTVDATSSVIVFDLGRHLANYVDIDLASQ